jgi:hypothetical protein
MDTGTILSMVLVSTLTVALNAVFLESCKSLISHFDRLYHYLLLKIFRLNSVSISTEYEQDSEWHNSNHDDRNNKVLLRAIKMFMYGQKIYSPRCRLTLVTSNSWEQLESEKIHFSLVPETTVRYQYCDFHFRAGETKRGKRVCRTERVEIRSRRPVSEINECIRTIYLDYVRSMSQLLVQSVFVAVCGEESDYNFLRIGFRSDKCFDNLFFPQREETLDYLRRLEDGSINRYNLLLHGLPGCGKSSLIKAIARETGRHIINIKLNNVSSDYHLMRIFYNTTIRVNEDVFSIPLNQRIYVFEDVDVDSKMVHQRESADGDQSNREMAINISNDGKQVKKSSRPTLSCLLNIIDGIVELPGTIIVFTTNNVGTIDPALIRPGRITHNIEMGHMREQEIRQLLYHHYGKVPESIEALKPKVTAAELENLCLRYQTAQEVVDRLVRNPIEK